MFPYLVLLQICLDLGLATGAEGGLVDGQQDHLIVVRQHTAVQPAVHGAHVLSSELSELVEALSTHRNQQLDNRKHI